MILAIVFFILFLNAGYGFFSSCLLVLGVYAAQGLWSLFWSAVKAYLTYDATTSQLEADEVRAALDVTRKMNSLLDQSKGRKLTVTIGKRKKR